MQNNTAPVFVFGSNLAGIHGAGSAHAAYVLHEAVWGCGIGHQGNSYAIPTKDEFIEVMSVERIEVHVKNFIRYATERKDLTFRVVAIGCGLAGFKPEQIAPMFKDSPPNVQLPEEFLNVLVKFAG